MILLLIAWGIYFFLHSFLADEAVKTRLTGLFKSSPRLYRIFYNLFNIIALAGLLLFLMVVKSPFLYTPTKLIMIAGAIIALAGSGMMLLAVRHYDLAAFFGLREETKMPLQTGGLHRYMRHPLYSGTILLVIGFCIAFPFVNNWITLLLMVIYIFIGMYFEEKKLVRFFGEEYRVYQRKVKQLIPFVL